MDDARALAGRLRERAANHLGEFYTAAVDRVLDLAAADLLDRLAAPEGVGLTRYSIVRGFLHEDVDGEWVRHEDAAAALAVEKARADKWENVALDAGVCPTCALGAPDAFGCTDCLNTGFAQGAPSGFVSEQSFAEIKAERDALKAEAITALLDEWMEFCLGIGHTQPNTAAIERFNSKLIIRHLNKIIGAKITQPDSLDALRAALAASTAREKVKDEEIERLREALESSAGKPDYTAWLVEPINVEIGVHYLSLSPAVVGYWTTNADLALHFARRIDAEQWLEHQDTISRCKVQVVEHTWPRAVLSGRKPDKEAERDALKAALAAASKDLGVAIGNISADKSPGGLTFALSRIRYFIHAALSKTQGGG